MNHELYLHESILLLGLDDEKGNFTTSLSYLNYGFAAALLMDLVLAERLSIEETKVILKSNTVTKNELLNEISRYIQKAKKAKKVSSWLHALVVSNNRYIRKAMDNLIHQGILERRKKKFLWIFKFSRYPTVQIQAEHDLRYRLRQIIFEGAKPKQKEIILLTIVQGCHMMKDLIPKKDERKMAKEKIKTWTADSKLQKLLGSAISEMETLVTVVTTV